ncbi:MAG: carbohydrate kinase family protein [Lachnospiraceae bacterium]|nr:carbohydrate kinase family protein [Lachnospiraceae bacterium]
MADMIVLGVTVLDMIVGPVTPAFFDIDSTPVSIESFPGGDACNVALNAAALGAKPLLVSAIGADPSGAWIRDYLDRHGVDTAGLTASNACGTAVSLVMTEPGGERHFLTSTEVFREISPAIITDDLLKEVKVLSLNSFYRGAQLDGSAVAALFHRARSLGVLTAVDTLRCRTGNALEQIAPVLAETDIFMPSFEEAVQITGQTEPEQMAEVIRPLGTGAFIVKLGSRGSFLADFNKKESCCIPAVPAAHPVNTVGAGDAFCAGLLSALLRGRNLYESACFASAAASMTVQVNHATGAFSSFEEVENYASFPCSRRISSTS